MTIFTIGHSNHSWENFVSLLRIADIETVVDVRTFARSRMAHFNQVPLRAALDGLGVGYADFGKALGGRSSIYEGLDYASNAKNQTFVKALEDVIEIGCKCRTALLCSEHEPLSCHRCLLLGRQLTHRGVESVHISRDSTLETHVSAEGRLLAMHRKRLQDLRVSSEEVLSMAYQLRERGI